MDYRRREHVKYGIMASLSPTSSSLLPTYVADSIRPYATIEHVWPRQSTIRKYLTAARTFHPNRQRWRDRFEAEFEHRLRVWQAFTRQLQNSEQTKKADFILQEGLHFDGFPQNYGGGKFIYLHGTLSMLIDSPYQCNMWMPPRHEREKWLELERKTLEKVDRILIGSRFLRQVLRERYQIPDTKIVDVGTGVPPFGRDEPLVPRTKVGKTFLFVGKDFERKGGFVLLKAFHLVRRVESDAELVIVGPNTLNVRLPDGAHFLGRVNDRNRLSEIFRMADVFVMPTLHESFGFVYLEAMQFNMPCIGTNIFAIPEIITDGETGLVIPPGDENALSDAMTKLIKNPQSIIDMGYRAGEKVRRCFSWRDVGKKIVEECGI